MAPARTDTDPGKITEPASIGAILAGGRSRRFGSDKGLAVLGGRPLVEWVLGAHRAVFPEVVIVVSKSPSPFDGLGVPVIRDERPGAGPLGGLATALRHAEAAGARGACCTSCDTPFLDPRILAGLVAASPGADAVLTLSRPGRGPEPLFAWYSTRLLPRIDRALAEGRLALHDLLAQIPTVRTVSAAELAPEVDPDRLFHNINSMDDLAEAERLFASSAPGRG